MSFELNTFCNLVLFDTVLKTTFPKLKLMSYDLWANIKKTEHWTIIIIYSFSIKIGLVMDHKALWSFEIIMTDYQLDINPLSFLNCYQISSLGNYE